MNQELKEIYIEIAKGITHHYDEDIVYIAKQIEKYADHPKNTDIIRKLAVLYYDVLPEDSKKDLVKVIRMDEENVHLLFYIAQYLISQKEKEKALDILTIVIEELVTWQKSDDITQYFSFDSMVDLLLYAQSFDTKKEIKRSKYPIHEFYRAIASIHFLNKDHEKSLATLLNALLYNPVSVDLLLDLAELSNAMQDHEQYFSYTKEALHYASEVEQLARCYRNIGNYFLQEADYGTAISSYYMSLLFEKHDVTMKALYSIYEITKQELDAPDLDSIKQVLDAAKIQVGASTLVVDTLLQLAKEYDEISERKDAIGYLEKAYRLTNDDSLLPIIEEMKATI